MKCLKVEEYIKRTSSVEEAKGLCEELEAFVKSGLGLWGQTVCDRIIRACNHHLGAGSPGVAHLNQLLNLVELAINGYDASPAQVHQSSPLYLEKIIFHVIKNLSKLDASNPCSHVAGLLYNRLARSEECATYYVLVRSCFTVIWNGLSSAEDKRGISPREKLHCQMQALGFLILMDKEDATQSLSRAPKYGDESICDYEKSCGSVSAEDAHFALQETKELFLRCCNAHPAAAFVLSEIALVVIKMCTKAGHYDPALMFLKETVGKLGGWGDGRWLALWLAKLGIENHSKMKAETDNHETLAKCVRGLKSRQEQLQLQEGNAVVAGCAFVMWTVENGSKKALNGASLLSMFSFLEQQQDLQSKMIKKPTCDAATSRIQHSLCVSLYQGFVFAYDAMQAAQLENQDTMTRVLLYLQSIVGPMMNEMRKLPTDSFLVRAVIAVSNMVCGLSNRRLYDQAFKLVEIPCRDLCKNGVASLAVDRINRLFMLAVQTSRWSGHLERALDWVILWLRALGDRMTANLSEPVSFWVKTKNDAARQTEEDIRLRTLRDGFEPGELDETVMLKLLDEELRGYKEVAADTTQERYNTLCDLLDICHEESSHTHLRAVYLCEMAQVVCFQDFSEQTDCTPVDFTHEALRLLDEEPVTPDNKDLLMDDKAHALLWLYICTLEKNVQEAIEKDKKSQEMREQSTSVTSAFGSNDFDHEQKQKIQGSLEIYEGLHFSLAKDLKVGKPLERALSEWSHLLHSKDLPAIRNPKQTCSSLLVAAALLRLMSKQLKALEAYQLAIGLSKRLGDVKTRVGACCHSASLLLDMGSPELAKSQLEQAEDALPSNASDELSSLFTLVVLLRSQLCYSVGQVDVGVKLLCDVLQEAGKQRLSKSWYMLRAQALQTCSGYLGLNAATLQPHQRNLLAQHGLNSPDTALYESQKLLCSLLVTLIGKGLYGKLGTSDVCFICQGDNLQVKWELLHELLNCSMKVVSVRTSCGALNDARLQCLEALKLAKKLQAFSKCAELLVVKAELELLQGEREECRLDLEKVRSLLESSTDSSEQEERSGKKIKLRKGRPAQRPQSPPPALNDESKSLLNTRWNSTDPIARDLSCSPPLKAKPRGILASLKHKANCRCSCCAEPSLARTTALWAATQADLVFQLDPGEAATSLELYSSALSRFKMVTVHLKKKLEKLFAKKGLSQSSFTPPMVLDMMGSVYLRMALSGLKAGHDKVFDVWLILRDGLEFVESNPSPSLNAVKANLTTVKAIVSLVNLASKENCSPEELFSHSWTWNSPKESLLTSNTLKKKGAKPVSKPKSKGTSIPASVPAKTITLAPKTPAMVKNKSRVKELDCFDFKSTYQHVPTFAFTPVRAVKAPSSVRKPPRTGGKQFQVFEEESPEKALPVPAAPRRTKKSIFTVDFSDESDSDVNYDPKEALKRSTAKRKVKKVEDPPAEIVPPRRTTRQKKSTAAAPASSSSNEDEKFISLPSTTRRGRTRKDVSRKGSEVMEEPDKMRIIEEDCRETLDMSIDQLSTSINEDGSGKDNDVDLEVLRKDMSCNVLRAEVYELSCKSVTLPPPSRRHTAPPPDNLSLVDVESLLCSAWSATHHFPSPINYSNLCSLLALSTGQKDSMMTAMLHSQSLGITSRHRTIRHLSCSLKKLKKGCTDLADGLGSLTLDDQRSFHTERLSRLEDVFNFSTAATLLDDARHEFGQQMEQLPRGVTVCVMSVLGLKPGEMGESILLSRLERGCPPVTVLIPTCSKQHSIRWLVQEMDNIQVEQKAVSCVSDKAKWWEGRRALDARVEKLLKEMETLLLCWKSLLLPPSSDPRVGLEVQNLLKTMSSKGEAVSEQMLKVLLSASPQLSKKDLQVFALGVSPKSDCLDVINAADELADIDEPTGHVVLVLDKTLQKMPWESIPVLKCHSVSRMPSLQSIIGLSLQKETEPRSILNEGVDRQKVFYVLDPDANLTESQDRFKTWFSSEKGWEGVCGSTPDPGQLSAAVSQKDLYVYVGHGAGARFLDGHTLLKQNIRAASLLFGCSSAALAVKGIEEGHGIVNNYLMAGCPFVLGMLWDVTDRDTDRFTQSLLESWFAAGSGSPLLLHMGPSRNTTRLKNLIGAAPVVYGFPVHLK